MMQLDALRIAYKLSENEINTLQARIIKKYTRNKTPVEPPTAVIIGGQPGSGKSELIIQALNLFRNNAVVCNADDYRDFHPKADEIKREHEKYYPEITVAYSQPWNNGLRDHCEKNRFNYILETTFSSGERMNDTIRQIKAKGYHVVIMVLAVPAALSVLGTHIRFEDMKRIEGFGRLVERRVHHEKYLAIPGTIETVARAKLYDSFHIYGRQTLQRKSAPTSGISLIEINPQDAVQIYLNERDKKWTPAVASYFNSACLNVVEMMVKRGATTKELKVFLEGLVF